MKRAIVIATTPTEEGVYETSELLISLSNYSKYPIVVLSDFSFEIGKLNFLMEHTKLDEWVLLHDSCLIKDTKLFDLFFYPEESVCLTSFPNMFGMYMGKWRRSILREMVLPEVKTKTQAVAFEETFCRDYASRDYTKVLFPDLIDSDVFVHRFGRKVMKIENEYIIKYKSCWNRNMLEEV
jgi:hypothetical protein